MVRRRKPGPKPKPTAHRKAATINARIDEDLRRELDNAAKAARPKHSLSAEVYNRLRQSFVRRRAPTQASVDKGLFSSPGVRLWALLQAREFHKAGAAAAGRAGIDTADGSWMKDPSCLLAASLSVVNALLRDLEIQPGADLGDISGALGHLKQRFDIGHDLGPPFIDKGGKAVKSGFFEKE